MKRGLLTLVTLHGALALMCSGAVSAEMRGLPAVEKVQWTPVASVDLASFNSDVVPGKPSVDVAIYVPSNFDPSFDKVSVTRMLEGLRIAKEIYRQAGLQVNLLSVKTGAVDPKFLSIQANEIPRVPDTEYINSYESSKRHPAELTEMALQAFQSMVEVDDNSPNTIYLLAFQDVVFPFLEISEGRNWTVKMVRTGGLSFPSYSYVDTIPRPYRGVITISNLSTPSRLSRTIAHEIGHKVMNVSHEYKDTNPAHEVYAEGGLMLYGDGVDIPSGEEGRWHLERLLMSPYVYRLSPDGTKQWNRDYLESGHYYDPIYEEKVVKFPGATIMNPNW